MQRIQLRFLVNMSKRYFDNTLENKDKQNIKNASQSLFYHTLYSDTADSHLNRQIRFFSVMTRRFSKDKPMSNKNIADLQQIIEYMQISIYKC